MELLARDAMSKMVVSVSVNDTVLQCAQLLRDRNITGAPVVNEDQSLVGVVSIRDLLPPRPEDSDEGGFYDRVEIKAEFLEGGVARIVDGDRPVREIMVTDVVERPRVFLDTLEGP